MAIPIFHNTKQTLSTSSALYARSSRVIDFLINIHLIVCAWSISSCSSSVVFLTSYIVLMYQLAQLPILLRIFYNSRLFPTRYKICYAENMGIENVSLLVGPLMKWTGKLHLVSYYQSYMNLRLTCTWHFNKHYNTDYILQQLKTNYNTYFILWLCRRSKMLSVCKLSSFIARIIFLLLNSPDICLPSAKCYLAIID